MQRTVFFIRHDYRSRERHSNSERAMNSKPAILLKTSCLVSLIFLSNACTKVNEIEVSMENIVKPSTVTKLTIVRTGTGSGEWNIADKDGFNYYFSSYPAGNFEVEVVKEKENTYCQTSESNEVTDGKMRNQVKRDMLIKEKGKGEITIAIACHKPMYHFFSPDSVVSLQMIVEDADNNVRDTVVFKIVRKQAVSLPL